MEQQSPFTTIVEGKTVSQVYRESKRQPVEHIVNGILYQVEPINRTEILPQILYQLDGEERLINNTTISTLKYWQRKHIALKVCYIALDHSRTFCGYETSDQKADSLTGIISELSYIFAALVSSSESNKASPKKQEINIPIQFKPLFERSLHTEVSTSRIARCILRGLEVARCCTVCEQVDPVAGGLIHVISTLLQPYIETTQELCRQWKELYLTESVEELSSPKIVGIVDIIIEMVKTNPTIYPSLFKFFSTEVEIPGFKGTYFEMTEGLYTD